MVNKEVRTKREEDFTLEMLKDYILLENGEILNSWWWIVWENGHKEKDYRMVFWNEDGTYSATYSKWYTGEDGFKIHATCSAKIIATANTKKELIEYKREIGLRKKPSRRKISKNVAQKIQKMCEEHSKRYKN